MEAESYYVEWLKRQSGMFRKSAEEEKDASKRKTRQNMADKMHKAAQVLETALAGRDADAMGGHQGLIVRLTAAAVAMELSNGETLLGVIRALGRYDVAISATDGERYVVPKHAVVYWRLLREPEEQQVRAAVAEAEQRREVGEAQEDEPG